MGHKIRKFNKIIITSHVYFVLRLKWGTFVPAMPRNRGFFTCVSVHAGTHAHTKDTQICAGSYFSLNTMNLHINALVTFIMLDVTDFL